MNAEGPHVRMPVLDRGYVQLIDVWGTDERIVEAARMSTNKGFLGWGPTDEHTTDCDKFYEERKDFQPEERLPGRQCACGGKPGDEKLLRFLWENGHTLPFEMCGATFEVAAPIMVFREWHRHRTKSYNELSARYTPLPDENYLPELGNILTRIRRQSSNKQEQGSGAVPQPEIVERWLRQLADVYVLAQDVYKEGLAIGIPKELARLPVPVGRYSKMRVSANLLNWLRFLGKRHKNAAQWEIRQYAGVISLVLEELFPRTMTLFGEGGSKV